jgi:hypothetical protein
MMINDWNSRGTLWPRPPGNLGCCYGDAIVGDTISIPLPSFGPTQPPQTMIVGPPTPMGPVLPSIPVAFDAMDLLKYGIAVAAGFWLGRR